MLPSSPIQPNLQNDVLRFPRNLNYFNAHNNGQWIAYAEDNSKHKYYVAEFLPSEQKIVVDLWDTQVRSAFYEVEDVYDAHTIDVAFDQNSRPMVAWATVDSRIFIHIFDPLEGEYATIEIGRGDRISLSMDNPVQEYVSDSDITLVIQDGLDFTYRRQRDRFLISYDFWKTYDEAALLVSSGYTVNNRFAIALETFYIDAIVAGTSQIYLNNSAIALSEEYSNARTKR